MGVGWEVNRIGVNDVKPPNDSIEKLKEKKRKEKKPDPVNSHMNLEKWAFAQLGLVLRLQPWLKP